MDLTEKEFIYHSILYDYEVIYGKTDKQSNRIELDNVSEEELRSRLNIG